MNQMSAAAVSSSSTSSLKQLSPVGASRRLKLQLELPPTHTYDPPHRPLPRCHYAWGPSHFKAPELELQFQQNGKCRPQNFCHKTWSRAARGEAAGSQPARQLPALATAAGEIAKRKSNYLNGRGRGGSSSSGAVCAGRGNYLASRLPKQ